MSNRFLKIVGSGINGQVCLVEQKNTFTVFAVKKLPNQNKFAERELHVWKLLSPHPNIVSVLDTQVFDDTYVFMEPMQMDLKSYIQKNKLYKSEVQWIFMKMMNGLEHCHTLKVMHRDIKPENVLLNANGDVKLCDFSLSRHFADLHSNQPLTTFVVTLWYRAPELLFGHASYDNTIDTWAACSVLSEMTFGRPIFLANENSEISQLQAIYDLIGSPNKEEQTKFNINFEYLGLSNCGMYSIFLQELPTFVEKTFVYDIDSRPSARDILAQLGNASKVEFRIANVPRASLYDVKPSGWDDIFATDDMDIDILAY